MSCLKTTWTVMCCAALLAWGSGIALSAEAVWTGSDTNDNLWTSFDNWSGLEGEDIYPGDGTTIYDIDMTDDTGTQATCDLDVSVQVGNVTVARVPLGITDGGALNVQANDKLTLGEGVVTGKLFVEKGGVLTLHSAGTGVAHFLTNNSEIRLGGGSGTDPAELVIDGSVTIDGTQGCVIYSIAGDRSIINEATALSALTTTSTVPIKGYFDIIAKLTNGGGVIATDHGPMVLKTRAKNGTGTWTIEKGPNPAKLQVDVAVSGSGLWWLADHNGEFEINAACTGLTGDLNASGGLLDINAAFESNGGMECDFPTVFDVDSSFVWGAAGCP